MKHKSKQGHKSTDSLYYCLQCRVRKSEDTLEEDFVTSHKECNQMRIKKKEIKKLFVDKKLEEDLRVSDSESDSDVDAEEPGADADIDADDGDQPIVINMGQQDTDNSPPNNTEDPKALETLPSTVETPPTVVAPLTAIESPTAEDLQIVTSAPTGDDQIYVDLLGDFNPEDLVKRPNTTSSPIDTAEVERMQNKIRDMELEIIKYKNHKKEMETELQRAKNNASHHQQRAVKEKAAVTRLTRQKNELQNEYDMKVKLCEEHRERLKDFDQVTKELVKCRNEKEECKQLIDGLENRVKSNEETITKMGAERKDRDRQHLSDISKLKEKIRSQDSIRRSLESKNIQLHIPLKNNRKDKRKEVMVFTDCLNSTMDCHQSEKTNCLHVTISIKGEDVYTWIKNADRQGERATTNSMEPPAKKARTSDDDFI